MGLKISQLSFFTNETISYEPIGQYQLTEAIQEIKLEGKWAKIYFEKRYCCFWCPISAYPQIKKFGPGDIAVATYDIVRHNGYSQCVIRDMSIKKKQLLIKGIINKITFTEKAAKIYIDGNYRCFWCRLFPEIEKKLYEGVSVDITYEITHINKYSQARVRYIKLGETNEENVEP